MVDTDKIVERLAAVEAKLDLLLTDHRRHMEHHFRYNLLGWSAVIAAFSSVVIAIVI